MPFLWLADWLQWRISSCIGHQNHMEGLWKHGFTGSQASLVAEMVKCLPATWETPVRSLGWEDPLVKEMATNSSTLAWKIPWTEEPGMLQSMGSQRVGHDWGTSLTRLVITFLPRSKRLLISRLQSPFAVILEPRKIKSDTVSTVSPPICHEVMGPDAMILVFWMLSFKLIFSLSSRGSLVLHSLP